MRNYTIYSPKVKDLARSLRRQGYTFIEIQKRLGVQIPKPTLVHWFKGIELTQTQRAKIVSKNLQHLYTARARSVEARSKRRIEHFGKLEQKYLPLASLLSNPSVAHIMLGCLYLAEGTKSSSGQLTFGNSNPRIIALFLKLLRASYVLDESKFRCTLQARADQDILGLEKFWQKLTGIPKHQFYKARIDPRSIGKATLKRDYKGVCRIDYFSAELFNEITSIGNVLTR